MFYMLFPTTTITAMFYKLTLYAPAMVIDYYYELYMLLCILHQRKHEITRSYVFCNTAPMRYKV